MELNDFQNQVINQAFVYIANGANLFERDPLLGLKTFSIGVTLISKNIPNYKFVITLEQLRQNEKLLNSRKKSTITVNELQQELSNLKTIINMRSIEKMRRSIDEKRNCVGDDVW